MKEKLLSVVSNSRIAQIIVVVAMIAFWAIVIKTIGAVLLAVGAFVALVVKTVVILAVVAALIAVVVASVKKLRK